MVVISSCKLCVSDLIRFKREVAHPCGMYPKFLREALAVRTVHTGAHAMHNVHSERKNPVYTGVLFWDSIHMNVEHDM